VPDIEKNVAIWNADWDWSRQGDEWSGWWGGTPALWHGALLPRIHRFLPTGTILEIAPGHGRWTQYLKDHCDRLIGVDLAERCVEHCSERFAGDEHVEFHVNDGRSLAMIEDASVDFAFSFDSLVHADVDVLDAYVDQLARKLRPDGVAFLHHSNAGALRRLHGLAHRVPERVRRRLVDRGVLLDIYAWRSISVTAEHVAERAAGAGLSCFAQERMSWQHGLFLMDALTLLTPRGSRFDQPPRRVRNPFFGAEGRRMRRLYTGDGTERFG
jgi:SAM-dependent methyltransferase